MTPPSAILAKPGMSRRTRMLEWYRFGRFLPWLVLFVSLAVSYQLWQSEKRNAIKDLQTDFDFRVRETDSRIDQRMKAYEQILRGARSLFTANLNDVGRARFHEYIDSLNLEDNFPGAKAIGFLTLVPAGQKDSHVVSVRKEGIAQYNIAPPGEREVYAPKIYVEPLTGNNPQIMGLDAYADPVRRTALEQARDSGKVAISGKVLLPLDDAEDVRVQGGFVMYLPVFKVGAPHDTPEERRANIAGWIYASFRMVDMMNGILGEVANEVDIEVHDGESLSDETMLYDPDISGAGGNPGAQFKSANRIEVANHYWTVVIRSLYGFESRMDRQKPTIIAYTGIGTSILLALFVWVLLSSRTRALQDAREMRRREAHVKTLNEQLALTFNELQAIMEAIPDLIYVINTKGELVKWNSMLEKFCGLSPEQMMRRPAVEFVCEKDRAVVAKGMAEVFERGAASVEARFIRHDGVLVPFLCNGSVFKNPDGEVIGFTGAGRDITELLEREKAMRLAESVFNTVDEAVLVTDPDNNIIAVNPAFTAITGYAAEEVMGENPRILSNGRHTKDFYREMWASLLATGSWHGEIWDRRKDGETYIKWLSIRLVRDHGGAITHHVGVFHDITERKAAEERMRHMAHHDLLTGLPNRMLLADRLQQALAKCRRDKAHLALMFMDLDKFKPINDNLGHEVGDLLLKDVAKRLRYCVRESDTVARVGGDEFVVLLSAIEMEQDAVQVAEKILYALNQSFDLAGHSLSISASIGIAVYPEHGDDEQMLTKSADIAMYYAKGSGRSNAKLYRSDMRASAL